MLLEAVGEEEFGEGEEEERGPRNRPEPPFLLLEPPIGFEPTTY